MVVQRCEERTTRSIGLFHLYLIRTKRFDRYQAETVHNLLHGQAVDQGDQDTGKQRANSGGRAVANAAEN